MFANCPFCGDDLLGTVEQTWSQVPLHEDGFDPFGGEMVTNGVVSVHCPTCKWTGDTQYYTSGTLPGRIPTHAHIGAIAGTTGEEYEEYTAYYVPPQSEDGTPVWLLTDQGGEREVEHFPTLVEAVREAFYLLRGKLGEDAAPMHGAGCPSNIILQLALDG